jgi:hypothetical protein
MQKTRFTEMKRMVIGRWHYRPDDHLPVGRGSDVAMERSEIPSVELLHRGWWRRPVRWLTLTALPVALALQLSLASAQEQVAAAAGDYLFAGQAPWHQPQLPHKALGRSRHETFRREFEGPCKDHGRNEANGQHHDHDSGRSIVETEQWEYGLRNLDEQPRGHHVGGTHAEYIAAFQFMVKRQAVCLDVCDFD